MSARLGGEDETAPADQPLSAQTVDTQCPSPGLVGSGVVTVPNGITGSLELKRVATDGSGLVPGPGVANQGVATSHRGLVATTEPGRQLPLVGFVPYKYIALFLLVAQTVAAIFVMRVSRTTYADPTTPYLVTTAVAMAELTKFVCSAGLVLRDVEYSFGTAWAHIKTEMIDNPLGTLKVSVPAFLYTLQNNLLFIALSNISGAVYQVTYQLKILTTAVLSVLILHRRLSIDRWLSLVLLTSGVALIQLPSGQETKAQGDPVVGICAVLAACVTSALAGVYLEKVLKDTKTSIWLRNMQLGLLGTALAVTGAFWSDWTKIRQHGFFQGYNAATWAAILMQSAGGLIVAAVLKYADNILKCFGNALAIVLSCLVSYYIVGDYVPTFLFAVGTLFVITATYTYGVDYPILFYAARPKVLLRPILKKLVRKTEAPAEEASTDPQTV
ncbi:UDP-N-acetylglucosamine transporter [Gregarina niphandrodes]|uniref:UDP-N-acetylglucosamine transporter n=1 Tax=Gregarina niphandrodes TaxID=110365 RepID=A0A023B5X5_GRENI|nr:UDP-N-acetylglucosamine transporter [Gregarina niphandrodes]EZG63632.1 UDP-N-acetylglucosamine transporter [Gregarina niphandrodes]|eukprot:XP_011130672.1 UDP-N-acetylglucosamine transporter [Gregarina niphandrodes]